MMHKKFKEKLKKSRALIFYEHVFCKIDEKPFSILYSDFAGRPNVPVRILLSLEYIKHMKNGTDAEIMDDLGFDMLVNAAIGNVNLGSVYFAERTLCYFRERVYEYVSENPSEEELLFGSFIRLLKGFVEITKTNMDVQRTDTTVFMGNIKKSGRLPLHTMS